MVSRVPLGGGGDRISVKRVLHCPNCGSTDLYYEAGMMTGQLYHCKDCGYVGSLVIEEDAEEA